LLLLKYNGTGDLLYERSWRASNIEHGTCVELADGLLNIAGYAQDIACSWEDLPGQSSEPSGVVGQPTGTSITPTGVVNTPAGTGSSPTATEDTGGGGDDALVMKAGLW